MEIVHSGWTKEFGSFRYLVPFDETKLDFELHFKSGAIGRQVSPFEYVTRDWNCDGDVYGQFGAWFQYFDKNGDRSGGGFWTPQDMVRAVIDANTPDASEYGDPITAIPGIEVPPRDKRPSIEEQVAKSERQRMMQDIERNRKMNVLGIRNPGDPWVK